MKTKITLLLTFLFLGVTVGFAQNDCDTKLSIFHEYVKAKNYEAAYKPWMEVRTQCPKLNNAIYVDGEKILKDKIEKTQGADKLVYVKDLIKVWDEKMMNFPEKSKKGDIMSDQAQLMYEYKTELNKTDEELYNMFDKAYTTDKENFKNPKALYTYFSLMVDLYDAGKKQAQELFNKYDDVTEKVETEVAAFSTKLNEKIAKENSGTALTSKDLKYKKYYESYLKNYDLISGSIDQKLGDRANCSNLVPLYERDFEANKTNALWLQRAAGKMSEKDCTSDPLFFKLVNAYHNISPSANSAYYLGILKDKEGKSSEAITYYEQAISLQTDNFKKSKLYYKIGLKLKSAGSFGKARSYFNKALDLNPSNGRPHLAIASMYASSAKNCGDSNFNKRAVFWLAANEARKAGRKDPTLSGASSQSVNSYMAKAPTKQEIFAAGNAGQTIKIGCWIGSSVTVPSL
ncbi:tetratricopeptide repeat protein [Lacinutrix salivirga]